MVKRPDREILERLYLSQSLSQTAIARKYSVSETTVGRWMNLYNIAKRKPFTKRESYDRHNTYRRMKLRTDPEWAKKARASSRKSAAKALADPIKANQRRQRQREWIERNKDKFKQLQTAGLLRLKNQTFAAYGGKCACCGEMRIEFLAIHHKNGGGGQHRKILKRWGHNFYRWLRQQGFPEEYQVLCHNCNCAKGFYGYCPHEEERDGAKDISV